MCLHSKPQLQFRDFDLDHACVGNAASQIHCIYILYACLPLPSHLAGLKTVDEYATGANQTIQFAWVNTLITTMTEQLALNPDRTAIYVEQAFYQRWWNQASDEYRNLWRKFIANGQAEFVGGGWCMPDEANEHMLAALDTYTNGNKFLMQEFGIDAGATTLA